MKGYSGKAEKDIQIRRLKKELAQASVARDILNNILGRHPPVRDRNAVCYARQEGSDRWLISGFDSTRKSGPWDHAHLRVLTPAVRVIPIRKMTNWHNSS